MFAIVFAALTLAAAAPASSDVYVDASAVAPYDGSPAHPFVSIQQAVLAPTTQDGSQIRVAPGDYCESVDFGPRTLSMIATGGPEVTIVHAAGSAPIFNSWSPWFVGVNVGGFTFTRDGASSPYPAVYLERGSIARCVLRDIPGTAFQSGFDALMGNCTVTGNGIGVLDGSNSCMYLRNSIVWGNAQDLVSVDGCTQNQGSHVGGSNPRFWNAPALDFHLAPGSPCIDAGVGTDPGGSPADQGAFLYDPGYAPAPANYCTGKLNSQGCVPSVSASGLASLTDPNPFLVVCANVVDQKAGLLLYGLGQQDIPFAGGHYCLLQTRRMPLTYSGGSGPCTGTLSYDFNARIQSGVDPALQPGVLVYMQFLYRDPLDAYRIGLSDALRIGIAP
jgi:hypothetical protein